MAELLAWVECYYPLVMWDIPLGHSATMTEPEQEEFRTCVRDMHAFVTFHMRPYEGRQEDYKTHLLYMSRKIWRYAACVERLFGSQLCKLNLHQAACHLTDFCV